MPTFGPMCVDSATSSAWVAANDGIYSITNGGILTKVSNNISNVSINGLCIVGSSVKGSYGGIICSAVSYNTLYYKAFSSNSNIYGDLISNFSPITISGSTSITCVTSDGTNVWFINSSFVLLSFSVSYNTSGTFVTTQAITLTTTPSLASVLTSIGPTSICHKDGVLYINNGNNIYRRDSAGTLTIYTSSSTPGQLAIGNGNILYCASNNLRQYDGTQWTTLSSNPITSVSMNGLTGYAVEDTSAVYTINGTVVARVVPVFRYMCMESATVAWVAANDGIYKITNGVMTKACTNNSNLIITGIGIYGTNLIYTRANDYAIYYKSTSALPVDIATGFTYDQTFGLSILNTGGSAIKSFTADGTNLCALAESAAGTTRLFIAPGIGATITQLSVPLTTGPASLSCRGNLVYLNNNNTIYSVNTSALTITTVTTASSPGPIALDVSNNVYCASSNLRKYDGTWSLMSSSPIVAVSMFTTGFNPSTGYAVDTAGLVYTVTPTTVASAPPTFYSMYMESATVAWVAASDGIYKIANGVMTKVCTNSYQMTITGIARSGSNLVFSTAESNTLFYKSNSAILGDLSTFTTLTSGSSTPLKCLTSDGTKLSYLNTGNTVYTMANISATPTSVTTTPSTTTTLSAGPASMCVRAGYLYINNNNFIYFINPSNNALTTYINASTPGPIAVDDGFTYLYSASNNIREFNGSAWRTMSSQKIVSVGLIGYAGYAVDASGAVYNFTSAGSDSGVASLALVPPPPITYNSIYMDTTSSAWVAASDGIYKITSGTMTKVCTNVSNWPINGIALFGSNLYISRSDSNVLYYQFSGFVTGDVNTFTAEDPSLAAGRTVLSLTSDATTLVVMDDQKNMIKRTSAGFAPLTFTNTQITSAAATMYAKSGIVYINATDKVYKYDLSSNSTTSVTVASPGPLAVDNSGNIFFANNGLYEYNASFPIDGQNKLTQLSSSPITVVGMRANSGLVVDASGTVYSITSSGTALATGAPQPPVTTTTTTTTTLPPTTVPSITTLPPPPTVQLTSTSSVADIVTAIGFTPPSTGLPRWASMIALGGEVASLSNLTRALIARADFDSILAARYGGVVTPAIAYNCQFLTGSVNVPIRR